MNTQIMQYRLVIIQINNEFIIKVYNKTFIIKILFIKLLIILL